MVDPIFRLLELDERHNELLEQLAELDRRINGVLGEWGTMRNNETKEADDSLEKAA